VEAATVEVPAEDRVEVAAPFQGAMAEVMAVGATAAETAAVAEITAEVTAAVELILV